VSGAVVVGALVVGVGVGLLLVGIVNLRSSADATLRSSVLLERVIQVERSVVDAETGLRGYVITGATVFLAPLRAAQQSLPGETTRLAGAAERDRDVAAARELSVAVHSFFATYVPRVLALMQGSRTAARSLAVTLTGKQRVDVVRRQTARLERSLTAQQTDRQRAANSTASADIRYGIIVLVVLVLLTIVIEGALGRLLVSRERALRRTDDTARLLQTSLLPLTIPDVPACELAIRFTPAGAEDVVGGDFYDVFQLDAPNRWAVVVGDVCGKGAEAAATTAVARWTLRSASLLTGTPTDALRHLNEVMRRRQQRFLFATIAYLLLDIRPDEVFVTVACAGHPPPIVLASGRPPAPATARGDLVGIWPHIRLETSEVRLAPGDIIVAYTDGATDFSRDPVEPLELFLLNADTTSPIAVASAIEARAVAGRPTPKDDIAIVAIQFNATAGADVSLGTAGTAFAADAGAEGSARTP
jgi:serine phosphatase RsbU (regulator of sigma subunit)